MAKYFSPKTDPLLFRCPCDKCEVDGVDEVFLSRLDTMRSLYGAAIAVNSGRRCPAFNAEVGGAPKSDHLTGEGADLHCTTSRARFGMLKAAFAAGFPRIGVAPTFIHVGVRGDNDQDVLWLYDA